MKMSVQQLTQNLCRLALASVKLTQPPSTQRSIHTGMRCLKNFNSRLPKNTKIGLFRVKITEDLSKPTLKPIQTARTGGRGPDGRIWVHRVGGGNKKNYRMVDFKKSGPVDGPPLVEKINAVRRDPFRTANIAVAVSGDSKRYILASENMAVGDHVKTSGKVTSMPVRAFEGDSHPIGSLPLGTLVYNVEIVPGEGGVIARAAGTSGVYVRRIGNDCVIRMPSKREVIVSEVCMVTVGRVSNPEHYKVKMHKAGQNRWRGKRPKSGWWQRKTGHHGRKIKPIKPAIQYSQSAKDKPEVFHYSL